MLTSQKILIAYGSRYGSTEGISHRIADSLKEEKGLEIDLLNLRQIKESGWPSITNYDAIIIGSGIRIGKWTKEAERLLRECKEKKNEKKIIIGVFVSCGYAADPKYYPVAVKNFVEKIFEVVGVKPDIYDAFGGVFDYSDQSKIKFLDRKILKMGARDLNLKVNYKTKNDYRNWDQIQNFTEEFASLLAK